MTRLSLRQMLTAVSAVLLVLCAGVPLRSASADQLGERSAPASHEAEMVMGTISRITDGMIFVKTLGKEVAFSSKFAARNGLADPNVGQELTMYLNTNNTVIDVHETGKPEPMHRMVTGNLVSTSDLKDEIKLWTQQGERTFAVLRGKSKLSAIEEGTPVTVKLNQPGDVIDVHRVDWTRMMVDGSISAIRSGVAFVKTPGGHATFPAAEMGPRDLAVGDEVVLHLNENNTVIDVHKKGERPPSHRFVTGNLTYLSDLKSEIKLWTTEGEKMFSVLRGKSKLSAITEGSTVTVEINSAGKIIDVRKAG